MKGLFGSKPAAPPTLTNAQLFALDRHRIDLILPNEKVISLPIFAESKGRDILIVTQNYGIHNFVICRNGYSAAEPYDVLYVDQPNRQLANMIKISEPFDEVQLSKILTPNILIGTRQQRMPLFIFSISEFQRILGLVRPEVQMAKLVKKSQSVYIRVRLPTGLVLRQKIQIDKKIHVIAEQIYDEMAKLYTTLKDKSGYSLRAIDGKVANSKGLFSEDAELMTALKRQKLYKNEPMFEYVEVNTASQFDEITKGYIRDLNLSLDTDSDEMKALNAAFSQTRREVETERTAILEQDPLRARMRIEPIRKGDDIGQGDILINVQVNGLIEGATTVGIKAPRQNTVNQVLVELFEKQKKKRKLTRNDDSDSCSSRMDLAKVSKVASSHCNFDGIGNMVDALLPLDRSGMSTSCENMVVKRQTAFDDCDDGSSDVTSPNPSDYILILMGMDEVLSGDNRLCDFVCVRDFLRSTQKRLEVILESKHKIIESIRNKELSGNSSLQEPGPESLSKVISVSAVPEVSFRGMAAYPHSSVHSKMSVYVKGCAQISGDGPKKLLIRVGLINATKRLCERKETRVVQGSTTVSFNDLVTMELPISSVPRTARWTFTLYERGADGKTDIALATTNFPVFRFDGWMNKGDVVRKMWVKRDEDIFLATSQSNEAETVLLTFCLPEFRFPLAFISSVSEKTGPQEGPELAPDRLSQLLKVDPLEDWSKPENAFNLKMLWHHRNDLKMYDNLLPLVLLAVDYSKPEMAGDVPRVLEMWKRPRPVDLLILLDASYADINVRKYAVKCIEEFTDHDLGLYMLQLVQALKYELYDDSALAEFLLRRSLAEPKFLGHQFFWQLVSELHIPHIKSRFSAVLVNFMYGIGSYTTELLKGYKFTQQLVDLNQQLQKLEYDEATERLQEALKDIEIPNEFHLPMDPRLVVDSFIIEKCKVMGSKKKPFWLCFKNASKFTTEPVLTMFKVGDDLRQDQLTLQIMKVMEYIWRQNGFDFHMRCYGVLPTGNMQGFIEIVSNSVTEASLQSKKGIFEGVVAKDIFINYFKGITDEKQATEMSDAELKERQRIFRKSSAGYAVATSVLGVGDRHPDNVMVQQDGHFFHIDFGHFLGNWKKKFGIPRESHLFHFSEASAAAIEEKDQTGMIQFQDESWSAMAALRRNSKLLLTLMLMMVGTGLPELNNPSQIRYMKDAMFLNRTDEEARRDWAEFIKESRNCTRTAIMNMFHNLRHRNEKKDKKK